MTSLINVSKQIEEIEAKANDFCNAYQQLLSKWTDALGNNGADCRSVRAFISPGEWVAHIVEAKSQAHLDHFFRSLDYQGTPSSRPSWIEA